MINWLKIAFLYFRTVTEIMSIDNLVTDVFVYLKLVQISHYHVSIKKHFH